MPDEPTTTPGKGLRPLVSPAAARHGLKGFWWEAGLPCAPADGLSVPGDHCRVQPDVALDERTPPGPL